MISSNPAATLGYLKPSNKRTRVLTQPQFEELLAAVEPFTRSQVGELSGFANELKALFLFKRRTGLRIQDCLTFPRSDLNGNRLGLTTKKTGEEAVRILPDLDVSALSSLSPERSLFRPTHFFWSLGCVQENLTVTWGRYIRKPCETSKQKSPR